MKSISFRDLKLVTTLAHLNELEMIHPNNDALMYGILDKLGFDIEYPIMYLANKHRDMQNKVSIGFRAVGEINIQRKHIEAVYTDLTTRLAASAYTDPSMTIELAELAGKTIDINSFSGGEDSPNAEDVATDMIEPSYQDTLAQMKLLESIRDEVRGPMYNEKGSPKVLEEYQCWWLDSQYYDEKYDTVGMR